MLASVDRVSSCQPFPSVNLMSQGRHAKARHLRLHLERIEDAAIVFAIALGLLIKVNGLIVVCFTALPYYVLAARFKMT